MKHSDLSYYLLLGEISHPISVSSFKEKNLLLVVIMWIYAHTSL
jgi:hypothetical protein